MAHHTDRELQQVSGGEAAAATNGESKGTKKRSRGDATAVKRRCVSTACIACRKRKSKCDGNTPACAACSSVYGTGISLLPTVPKASQSYATYADQWCRMC